MYQITTLNFSIKRKQVHDRDLAHFFVGWSRIEKLFEISPPFYVYSIIWPPPVAIYLALWVWEAFGAIQDEKYLKWQ